MAVLFYHLVLYLSTAVDFPLCVLCLCSKQLGVGSCLVVTRLTSPVRQRVWRSQCRAMTCQRWAGRLWGEGEWVCGTGSALMFVLATPDPSSPLSGCVLTNNKHYPLHFWRHSTVDLALEISLLVTFAQYLFTIDTDRCKSHPENCLEQRMFVSLRLRPQWNTN